VGGDTAGTTLSIHDRAGERPGAPTRAPQLVIALECSRPGALSARYALTGVHTVHLGRALRRAAERFDDGQGRKLVVGVPDRWMSSAHARLEHSFGRWVLEDSGSKNGTIVNGQATKRAVLRDGDLFELGHTLFIFRESVPLAEGEPEDIDLAESGPHETGLVTLDPELAASLAKVRQIAASPIPLLVQGESGTGKEVLARAVHRLSGRTGEFVAVNCGAIPENLVESELFGYRKGAFSGANEDRPGLVRTADRGTLFLDEIGDLPASSQAALLRVLQQREVMPVGGARPLPVDLRVLAATHRDLDSMVEKGEFRRDLFARLTGYRIVLPPLRERLADLGMLIGTVLRDVLPGGAEHPGVETETARCLFAYDWPLNVRELEQSLRAAAVLAGAEALRPEHLPEMVRHPPLRDDEEDEGPPSLGPEDEERRAQLVEALRLHHGNISAVARALNKDRKQIQRWVKRFRLDPDSFR
jgi:transcriptional regulator with PAS, ATPase and Fis domain